MYRYDAKQSSAAIGSTIDAPRVKRDSIEEFSYSIQDVFDDLCRKNDSSVLLFQETFDSRSRQHGFPESNRLFGVKGVLRYLLRQAPCDRYYKRIRGSGKGHIRPIFQRSVKEALIHFATSERYVLEEMKEYVTQHRKNLRDLLPALFRFYAENEERLPT